MERLGLDKRPEAMSYLQAAAAAGQSQLMRRYEGAFEPRGVTVAQVLLTHAELADRERYLNARNALQALLDLGAVPIINENDAVAVDEIRFGDNDQLAAMVAVLVGADLLLLLTDVEGLQDGDGQRVPMVRDVQEILPFIRESHGSLGSGGMRSKVEAARRATLRGIPVVVTNVGDGQAMAEVLGGEDRGTLFLPNGARLASRKHWIAYTLKPKGAIVIDEGAAAALTQAQRSLLPAGVIAARGDFSTGDCVSVITGAGREVARGLSQYSTGEVAKIAGVKTGAIAVTLGYSASEVVIHRDDLVITEGEPELG